ncbi:hypothetical Protein YC6258_02217 [Gynuella sunshinyii YC6258]|uniref:Uncharacterized protein n=2 Tax=Gynuella sunshinyii TaxID=1445505 RepID=A0A0C5V476_9GAMM|nr:hypothetical Protein YC6258_02217 [Gynuella sunshinyii YC6258]
MPENDRLFNSSGNAALLFNTDSYLPHEKDADKWASGFLSGNCECEQ